MASQWLLHNAKIYQSSEEDKCWMTFDSKTGYITEIGRVDPPIDRFPKELRKDCGGRRVLPGLHDSHLHVEKHGAILNTLNLHGSQSIQKFQEQIREYAIHNPDKKWIVGRGWEQDVLGRYPTKEDIDEVCPDVPVIVTRICGHVACVNSRALSVTGINDNSEDPHGGVIERYPPNHKNHGKPNGMLLETAVDIIWPFVHKSSDEIKLNVKTALSELLRNGITSAHACEIDTWNEFCSLSDEGNLPIRIFFSGYFKERTPGNFPFAKQRHGELLSCDRVKLFVDGALGTSTAALSHPYCSSSHNKGILFHSQENLTQMVKEATGLGYRLEIHVIGDDAADKALDAIESANVSPDKRPILTHCQILRADLVHRMKERGVIANIQPQFVTTDARWLSQLLPPQLMDYAYAWKTLMEKGIPCAGGSDAPVETPNSLIGIYDAIFRNVATRSQDKENVFRPEECLSVKEAIDLYTKWGAYATMKEDQLGQLLPGFLADFVILDKDVCSNPVDLLSTKILEVWIGGNNVFRVA